MVEGSGFKRELSILLLLITALTGFYALLSGPAAELFGVKKMLLSNASLGRASRIVLVYHTLAVPFIAFVATFMLSTLEAGRRSGSSSVSALVAGSFLASISGAIFAYFSSSMFWHGLYITGLAVVFFGGLGILMVVYRAGQADFGTWIEKAAMLLLTVSILISAGIGGFIGSYYGTAFKSVLAEDIIRKAHGLFERAVISHLHIMLALTAAAILMLIVRYFGLEPKNKRFFYPLYIAGVLVTSISTWAVIVSFLEKKAHKIINVGATLLIAASIIWVVEALKKEWKSSSRNWFKILAAFHLLSVNLTVTLPGVYVAFNLEKFRQPDMLAVERSFAVGHWHLLGVTCALLVSALFFNFVGLKRRPVAVSSAVLAHFLIFASFLAANAYMFTRKTSYLALLELTLAPGFVIFLVVIFYSFISGFREG